MTQASQGPRSEAAKLRHMERRWQNEVGHALLAKPFEDEGSALVFERQFERVEAALEGLPGGPLVEVGCGLGQFLEHLRSSPVGQDRLLVGVDVSVAVEALPARGAVPVRADGEELPFRDGSVAAVVYNGSLHHVVDYRRAVREAFRVLAPGGRFVAFEPSSSLFSRMVHRALDPIVFKASLEYESPVDQHLKHAFREEAVVEEVSAQGATVTRSKSDFLAYPVTGCYAGSLIARIPRLMRGLVTVERAIEHAPGLRRLARLVAWRFLIVADKPGAPRGTLATSLAEILGCPRCHGALAEEPRGGGLSCPSCHLVYPRVSGVPVLLSDEASRSDQPG